MLIAALGYPFQGEHVREGLGAVVSVKVPNPEFEGQTKARLGNPEVRRIVDAAVQAVSAWRGAASHVAIDVGQKYVVTALPGLVCRRLMSMPARCQTSHC